MKTKYLSNKSSELTNFEMIGAIATACGFWISLFFACRLGSNTVGALPGTSAMLLFGVFVVFFAARMFNSWSRLPAILGLCSWGVLASFYWYLNYALVQLLDTEAFILLSLGLAFVGVALDMERCWHLITNERIFKQASKPMDLAAATGHVGHKVHP